MHRPHPPCTLAAHGRSFLHPGPCMHFEARSPFGSFPDPYDDKDSAWMLLSHSHAQSGRLLIYVSSLFSPGIYRNNSKKRTAALHCNSPIIIKGNYPTLNSKHGRCSKYQESTAYQENKMVMLLQSLLKTSLC